MFTFQVILIQCQFFVFNKTVEYAFNIYFV